MLRYAALPSFVAICFAALASVSCGQGGPSEAERHGAHVYQRMCAVCHGSLGAGYKADQAPALTRPDFLGTVTNEHLHRAIANGRTGTTMSAWATDRGGPLSHKDVDAVIAFLRGWDRRPHPVLDERPLRGTATRGASTFLRECSGCHGDRGMQGPFVRVGNADLLATASNGFLRQAIRGGRPGTAMPAFSSTLGDDAIDDVIAALRAWQSAAPASTPAPSRPPPIPLGRVPIHPNGPDPRVFQPFPTATQSELVKKELDRGAKMVLLDARAPSDYVNEHISGAVSVPFYDPDPYFSALPKDAWLVCYCACPHAESSTLAQKLRAAGFPKVTVLDEGIGFWRSKGYGTRGGTEP